MQQLRIAEGGIIYSFLVVYVHILCQFRSLITERLQIKCCVFHALEIKSVVPLLPFPQQMRMTLRIPHLRMSISRILLAMEVALDIIVNYTISALYLKYKLLYKKLQATKYRIRNEI